MEKEEKKLASDLGIFLVLSYSELQRFEYICLYIYTDKRRMLTISCHIMRVRNCVCCICSFFISIFTFYSDKTIWSSLTDNNAHQYIPVLYKILYCIQTT